MKDPNSLINENKALKQRVAKLEDAESELKKANRKLQQSKNMYRSVAESINDGFIVLETKDLVVTYYNTAIAHFKNFQAKEVINKSLFNLFPEIKNSEFEKKCRLAQKTKKKLSFEYLLSFKSHNNWYNIQLLTEEEKIFVFFYEISKYKQLEENLKNKTEEIALQNEELQAQNEELSSQNEEIKQNNAQLAQLNNLLETEKNRAQHYLDIAGNMFIALDKNGIVTLANRKAAKILGYPEEEIIGKNWFNHFLPQKSIDEVKIVFRKIIAGDIKPVEYVENKVLTKNNEVRVIAWHNSVLRNDKKEITGLLSSGEDITERKQAEQALIENEKKYRSILNNTSQPVFIKDKDGKYLYINKIFEQLHGTTNQKIKGLTDYDIFAEVYANMYRKNDLEVLKRQTSIVFEESIPIDKKIQTVLTTKFTLHNHKGNPYAVCGIATDITERKKTEDELHKTKVFYESILEGTQDGIWVSDKHDIIYYANRAMGDIAGIPPEKICGNHVLNDFPKETTQEFKHYYLKAKETLQSQWYEITVHTPGGQDTYQNGWIIPIIQNNTFNGMITTIRDVTERVTSEKALRESEQKMTNILENSTNLFYQHDVNHKITYLSPQVKDILGYTTQEAMVKWTSMTTNHPINQKGFQATVQAIKTGKAQPTYELELQHKSGKKIWVEVREAPLTENGKTVAIVGALTDINDRKIAETKLKDSERKFSKAFMTSPYAIIIVRISDGKILEINHAFTQIFGFSRETALQSTTIELNIWQNNKNRDRVINALKNGEILINKEFSFKTRNGEKIIGLFSAQDLLIGSENCILYSINNITERKYEQEKLIQKEKEFREIFNSTSEAIVVQDVNTGDLIDTNDVAVKMYGFETKEELLSTKFSGLSYGRWDDIKWKALSYIKKAISHGPQTFEWQARKKDGSAFWVEVSLKTSIIGGEGRVLAVARDITERKKAELALRESEKKFRSYVEYAPDGIFIANENGKYVEINRAACKITGYTKQELLSMHIPDLIQEDEQQKGIQHFKELQKHGFASNEIGFKTKVGEKRYWIVDAVKLSDNRFLGFTKDITLQKEATEKLKKSEDKFKGIFNHANIGMVLATPNGDVTEINNEIIKLLQYPTKELIGLNFRQFTHPEDLPEELELLNKLYKNEIDDYRIEKRYINAKGDSIWVDVSVTCRKNDEGRIDMLIGMIININEQKKTRQELIEAKLRAEEADRLKSAFLANMSHEIRTPMNGILGFVSLLKKPNLSGEKQQKYIDIIKKSGDRMLDTVNDIIDISKIDAGQVEVAINEMNIYKEIDALYIFFKPEAETKGLKLKINTELTEKQAYIKTDKSKLNSVITNLIKNAIKYTDTGYIEIGYNKKNTLLYCYVKDTGIGIPKKRQEAIFNRFEQADIDDINARQGAGLGLSISKSYIEMLHGKLWLESEVGKGTTFHFTIPWYTSDNQIIRIQNNGISDKSTNLNKKPRVLIAEDDATSLEYLKTILENIAGEIIEVSNGAEAVKQIKNNPDIDCIFMDIKMPVMNGYEASRKIREFNKTVTIIAQTAYAFEGDRKRAIQSGCNSYITKPIKKQELLNLLSASLETKPK